MSRDPMAEPRFGDVFEVKDTNPGWSHLVLFLDLNHPDAGDWWGLELDTPNPEVVNWTRLRDNWTGWQYVGSIEERVEMTCEHAHRGTNVAQSYADTVWRGCAYRRLA